jgi:hypothetical protein
MSKVIVGCFYWDTTKRECSYMFYNEHDYKFRKSPVIYNFKVGTYENFKLNSTKCISDFYSYIYKFQKLNYKINIHYHFNVPNTKTGKTNKYYKHIYGIFNTYLADTKCKTLNYKSYLSGVHLNEFKNVLGKLRICRNVKADQYKLNLWQLGLGVNKGNYRKNLMNLWYMTKRPRVKKIELPKRYKEWIGHR